jgi:heat shock protein HtpX
MTISVTLVGLLALLSDVLLRVLFFGGGRDNENNNSNPLATIAAIFGFLLVLLAPLIARLMQFAVSRLREYLADASGVQLTRYPPGLISALKKLEDDKTSVRTSSKATAHLWIEEPLDKASNKGQNRFNRAFDTHPPIEDRIHALEAM